MMSFVLVKKICRFCGNERKFVKDSPRDVEGICGNCWEASGRVWMTDDQMKIQKLENEMSEMRKMLQEVRK